MLNITSEGPINIYDVGNAPNRPGVYVWYARPDIAKADWHAEFAGGAEKASHNLLNLIQTHSIKHGSQNIHIEATAHFSNRWCGILSEVTEARWGQQSLQTSTSQARLNKLCEHEMTRGALVEMVKACFPNFFGPLYIGRATNQTLRKRLRQHANAFRALWVNKADIEDSIDNTNFAARAFSAGFSPGELYCYVIPVDAKSTGLEDEEQIHDLIETVEWLLNRWSLPTLGKQ